MWTDVHESVNANWADGYESANIKGWMYGDKLKVFYNRGPVMDGGSPGGFFRSPHDWVPDAYSYKLLCTARDTGRFLYATGVYSSTIYYDGPFVLSWEKWAEDATPLSADVINDLITSYDKIFKNTNYSEEFAEQYGRYRENLVRACSKIEEYGLCNDWDLFGTITVNKENLERDDFTGLYNLVVRRYFKNERDRLRLSCKRNGLDLSGADFDYLIVPELHKDGCSYHLHGLFRFGYLHYDRFCDYYDMLGSDVRLPRYIKDNAKEEGTLFYDKDLQDICGYNTFSIIKDKDKSVRYLIKYLKKGLLDISRMIAGGKNLYWHSLGLQKKVPIDFREVDREAWTEVRRWQGERVALVWLKHKDST